MKVLVRKASVACLSLISELVGGNSFSSGGFSGNGSCLEDLDCTCQHLFQMHITSKNSAYEWLKFGSVVVCSFVYGNNNSNTKTKYETYTPLREEKSPVVQLNEAPTSQQHAVAWPSDPRNSQHTEIDLTPQLDHHQTLNEFISIAESEVGSVTNLYSVVDRNADALALYFGEDPARCPFEQVIERLVKFVRVFRKKKAHEENFKQAEMEKKKAQKESEWRFSNGAREPLPLIIHHLPVAVTFGFIGKENTMVIDPTHYEETVMGGSMTTTLNTNGDVCAIYKAGGEGVPHSVTMQCLRIASVKADDITNKIKNFVESYNTERSLRKVKRHNPSTIVIEFGQQGCGDVAKHHMERLNLGSDESSVISHSDDVEIGRKLIKNDKMEKRNITAKGSSGGPATWYVKSIERCINKANSAELNLFLEVEVGLDLFPIPPPAKTKEEILLFFKLYDPLKEELRNGKIVMALGGGFNLNSIANSVLSYV
ncbi:unnamed protein product [Lactuca virosa]|uniref:Exoribonuclease phosphorolytic domain-containing protein n=1 Tax=Lactuca virosa TaxID=75947 RepID=A0AAU9LX34_9ASTR|nr:unnamed protein product [Lactuca virosa]